MVDTSKRIASVIRLTHYLGDNDKKAELEAQVAAFDVDAYWATHDSRMSVMAYQENAGSELIPPPAAPYNMYESYPSGRRLSETVSEFLNRLPPRSTLSSEVSPWIYIANPHCLDNPTSEDLAGFRQVGHRLLEEYTEKKEELESSLVGKPKGTVTKKLTPYRKKLEADIFTAAKEKGIKSGKWMLFPPPDRVNEMWALVANAVAKEELGHAAKVAANDGSGDDNARLICVYTENFADKDDVKRVLETLVGLGLVSNSGDKRAIYYKADCFTHLDIMGGNQWGLKPSLYSSADILGAGKR